MTESQAEHIALRDITKRPLITATKKELDQITKFVENVLTKKPTFYGKIRLNFQNGLLVNLNIEETITMKKSSVKEVAV